MIPVLLIASAFAQDAATEGFDAHGLQPADLRIHLGPAVCGNCYEVSADVATQLLGIPQSAPRTVDLRAVIAAQARSCSTA